MNVDKNKGDHVEWAVFFICGVTYLWSMLSDGKESVMVMMVQI